MFHRYSEAAERIMVFAKIKADDFGSHNVEIEHLLLGLLQEPAAVRFFSSDASLETIQREISEHTHVGNPIPPGTDRPISQGLKRVLRWVEDEANSLKHGRIDPGHLLLGLLREQGSLVAQILQGQGLTLATLREELAQLHNP